MRRRLRRAAPWLATAISLYWFWMLLVGEWNEIELVAAAVAAVLAASAAELIRAAAGVRFRIPLRLAGQLASAFGMVVVDFGIVIGALLGSAARGAVPRGRFVVREFAAGGDDAEAFGRRAWTTLLASYSPNAYPIDIDPEHDVVLLHDLVTFRKSEKPA